MRETILTVATIFWVFASAAVAAESTSMFGAWYSDAYKKYYAGNYAEGLAVIDRELKEHPRSTLAISMRGLFLQSSGRNKEAIETYSQSLAIDPDDVFALQGRSGAYQHLLDYPKAIKDLDAAIQLEPENGCLFNNRAICYEYQGNLDNALRDYNKACKLHPTESRHYLRRSSVYFKLGKEDLAKEDCERAGELAFEQLGATKNRRVLQEDRYAAFMGLKNYQRANDIAGDILKEFPQASSVLTRYAFAQMKLGNYKEAIDYSNRAMKKEPDNAWQLYAVRGRANYFLGNYKQALADFNISIEKQEQAAGVFWRGKTQEKLGNKAAAARDAARAKALYYYAD